MRWFREWFFLELKERKIHFCHLSAASDLFNWIDYTHLFLYKFIFLSFRLLMLTYRRIFYSHNLERDFIKYYWKSLNFWRIDIPQWRRLIFLCFQEETIKYAFSLFKFITIWQWQKFQLESPFWSLCLCSYPVISSLLNVSGVISSLSLFLQQLN